MAWWRRLILTLGLGPIIWWVLSGYVATQQGASFAQWLADSPNPSVCLALAPPAALLCLVLTGMERLLTLASLDLFTVLLSPIAGFGLAAAAVDLVPLFQGAGGSVHVFTAYGLAWGLTIREPRKHIAAHDRSDGAFVDALLPQDKR